MKKFSSSTEMSVYLSSNKVILSHWSGLIAGTLPLDSLVEVGAKISRLHRYRELVNFGTLVKSPLNWLRYSLFMRPYIKWEDYLPATRYLSRYPGTDTGSRLP